MLDSEPEKVSIATHSHNQLQKAHVGKIILHRAYLDIIPLVGEQA